MTDAAHFIRNQNKLFPPDVMRPYAGYIIAWSQDGKRMLAYAREYDDLFAEVDRLGLGSADYVVDGSIADYEPPPTPPRGLAKPSSSPSS